MVMKHSSRLLTASNTFHVYIIKDQQKEKIRESRHQKWKENYSIQKKSRDDSIIDPTAELFRTIKVSYLILYM